MKFTRTFQNRPKGFRGHDFSVDERTMSLPDAVPTLREIVLSGSMNRVGTPQYDSSFEEGEMRWTIQQTPIDVVLNARENGFEDAERSDKNNKPSNPAEKDNAPAETSEAGKENNTGE